MTTRLLIAFLLFCGGWSLVGSPASDLSSPSQAVREAAAKIIRQTYTAPSRTNWEAVVSGITNGMTPTNVLELLSRFKVTSSGGYPSDDSYNEVYRLDEAWVLVCGFRNKSDVLFERRLSPSLRYVWVAPPSDFTGVWVTYYVNGQKSREIHYEAGKYHGQSIKYYSDGSKEFVRRYNHHVLEGTSTSYFASGRTNYQGDYKAGKEVGTWVFYYEDGSTKSKKEYSRR
jgi:hypothetical protein